MLRSRRLAWLPWRTRNSWQAMRVLATEDDEVLATAVTPGLRPEGSASGTWGAIVPLYAPFVPVPG